MQAGAGTAIDFSKLRADSKLGLFVRVRLDREAAKRAFDKFLNGKCVGVRADRNTPGFRLLSGFSGRLSRWIVCARIINRIAILLVVRPNLRQ